MKALNRTVSLFVMTAAVILAGCSEDRPTGPSPSVNDRYVGEWHGITSQDMPVSLTVRVVDGKARITAGKLV